jgi:hypothetical protein
MPLLPRSAAKAASERLARPATYQPLPRRVIVAGWPTNELQVSESVAYPHGAATNRTKKIKHQVSGNRLSQPGSEDLLVDTC